MINLNNKNISFKGLENNFKVDWYDRQNAEQANEELAATSAKIEEAKALFLSHRPSDGDKIDIRVTHNTLNKSDFPQRSNITVVYGTQNHDFLSNLPFATKKDPKDYISSLNPQQIVDFVKEALAKFYPSQKDADK